MPAVDTSYVGNTNGGSIAFAVTPGLNYKLNDNLCQILRRMDK